MNGESVAQAMGRERLGKVAEPMRLLASLLYRILGDVLPRSVAREQPMERSCHSPPLAQGNCGQYPNMLEVYSTIIDDCSWLGRGRSIDSREWN